MSDIEIAVKGSKLIEGLLEQKLGATGKGLHSKLTSVENSISASMVSKIRYIASTRNAVVHETDATIRNVADFKRAVSEVEAYLNTTDFKTKLSWPKLTGWKKKLVYILAFFIILKIIARLILKL